MNQGMLEEFPLVDLLLHSIHGGEMIVLSVLFSRSRRTRRVADAEAELVVAVDRKALAEEIDQRSLSHAAGTADDDRSRRGDGRIGRVFHGSDDGQRRGWALWDASRPNRRAEPTFQFLLTFRMRRS